MSSMIRIVIVIQSDYDRAESTGAEETFRVAAVYGYNADEHETDLSSRIDPDKEYGSTREAAKDLGLNPDAIDIEEEYEEK
ncbi:hypothetical protein QWJ34_17165 [Saccharibacillus sp. CPCC 101409]|uniref:hypothetical protein n=1 Tax=Saccharibacillus sp. CPCC 101409 TaxID=3058041 RepID=UPI0026734B90|nr:hypothetical protein [Saccharibacillus sp. CPCC 101409]MDO3411498.1 hypothetical protein [Saccharibacillus sp. CPCC 101409]